MKTTHLTAALLATLAGHIVSGAELPNLPGTTPLEPHGDFSAEMVAGIDRLAMKEIEAAVTNPRSTKMGLSEWRSKYRMLLGVADLKPNSITLSEAPSRVSVDDSFRMSGQVRWTVLENLDWDGLLIGGPSKGHPHSANLILIPDADVTPEQVLAHVAGFPDSPYLEMSGCRVLVPTLLNRSNDVSGYPPIGKATNVTHREWIFRQAFELGRHPLGYEVQAVLAAIDWFSEQHPELPIYVAGFGEGGRVALAAAALDDRVSKTMVSGAFTPRSTAWKEPLDRTFFNLLSGFDDAEVAARIAPRYLWIAQAGTPIFKGAPEAKPGQRSAAAPGELAVIPFETVEAEAQRARTLAGERGWLTVLPADVVAAEALSRFIGNSNIRETHRNKPPKPLSTEYTNFATERQARLVHAVQDFTQKQIVTTERERDETFWKPLKGMDLPAFEKRMATERERFGNDVIGRLPDPDVPMNPRSRLVRETETVAIYEVVLDVWDGVIAWGWLALPKDLDQSKPNPVVVCQHGLEGLPEQCFETDETTKAWRAYKAFALRLAEEGFVTFAPHNPYRGGDAFRVLQRKFNLTGRTLFSPIIGQHQRILEWLKTQPFVDPERIAFYGLSYGGKSAMRIPAILTDYCLSICSGDFNEWVRKCVSLDMPMSYLYTHEYEIWEWDLGRTFNYAEMAALIAPRPFMVERGHDDGVGLDEWVNYEYAKVRRLYNKLGIGDRTTIEHFDGPHTIHGVGTFEFLHHHLTTPKALER